jgi:hypothetical protein
MARPYAAASVERYAQRQHRKGAVKRGTVMALRDFLGYPKPSGFSPSSAIPVQYTYLDPKNITYPGVAVIAGVILNFLATNVTGEASRIWVSLIISLIFGGFILFKGLTDGNNAEGVVTQVFVCLVNTFLLWIVVFSVAAVDPSTFTGTPTPGVTP